jgi:hypothetical protein
VPLPACSPAACYSNFNTETQFQQHCDAPLPTNPPPPARGWVAASRVKWQQLEAHTRRLEIEGAERSKTCVQRRQDAWLADRCLRARWCG